MKYMLMFCGTVEEDAAWRALPADEFAASYAGVGAWFEEHGSKMEGGYELQPPGTATTVRKDGSGKPVITDGPYAESGEVIGGYCIVDVADLDEALSMAKAWPGGPVEIRPVVVR